MHPGNMAQASDFVINGYSCICKDRRSANSRGYVNKGLGTGK